MTPRPSVQYPPQTDHPRHQPKKRVTMNTTTTNPTPTVLGPTIRTVIAAGLLTLLGWAAIAAPGCGSQGKYTHEHITGAKAKMAALKSATEYKMGEQAFLAGDLPKALKHVEYSLS